MSLRRLKTVRFNGSLFVAGIGGDLAQDEGERPNALHIYQDEAAAFTRVVFFRDGIEQGSAEGYGITPTPFEPRAEPGAKAEKKEQTLPGPKKAGRPKGSVAVPRPAGKRVVPSSPNVLKPGPGR